MFHCKVCAEKDRRISDLNLLLKTQIDLLEKVIAPNYSKSVSYQADLALNGAGHDVEVEEPSELTPAQSQAIAMLTASY